LDNLVVAYFLEGHPVDLSPYTTRATPKYKIDAVVF